MKRNFAILFSVFLLLILGSTTVFAGGGKGDPQPEVGYRVIDSDCGVPAGDYGFFVTSEWWWATYSNGRGVLKCVTHLEKGQTPPAETITIPVGLCGTPGGSTEDAFTRIFPNGAVHLICRVK